MTKKLFPVLFFSACSSLATSVPLAQTPARDSQPIEQLLVTGADLVSRRSDSLPETVFNRDDIVASQTLEILDLLRLSNGLQIGRNGGVGTVSSVFIRGAASTQLLVLVDGVRANSITSGASPWNALDLSQIEEIRIRRGPQSVTWGADAIGGVIEIQTRGGAKPGVAPDRYINSRLRTGFGNRDRFSSDFSLDGSTGEDGGISFSLGLSYDDTEGIDARSAPATNSDLDAWRRQSYRLSVSRNIGSNAVARLSYYDSESEAEYDEGGCFRANGCPSDIYSIERLKSTNFRFEQLLSNKLSYHLNIARIANDSENFASFTGKFNTIRYSAGWHGKYQTDDNALLLAGVDYYRDEVDSSTNYTEESRYNYGVYIERQFNFERSWLNVAVRYDDNEQFGGNTVGSVDWGRLLSQSTSFIARAATAFRAPTFNDLYFPCCGNPDLKPEDSLNLEVGLTHKKNQQTLAVNVFHHRIYELIVFDLTTFRPQNISEALIRGIELMWKRQSADWRAETNYSYTDPRDRATDRLAPRRARHKFSAILDRHNRNWQWGLEAVWRGKRFDDLQNTTELGSYFLLAARIKWQLQPGWSLQLKLDNLLDRDYQTVSGFNQEGFGAALSLIINPQSK